MLTVKCIERIRGRSRAIEFYKIQDMQGEQRVVTANQLKQAIRNKQVICSNLTLTSDNRLIGNVNKKSDNLDVQKLIIKARALGKSEIDYDNMTFVIQGNEILLKSVNIKSGTVILPSFMSGYITTKEGQYNKACSPFENCIDIKVINNSQITTMQDLFQCTESLKELDLSNFDASRITSLSGAFNLSGVQKIYFGNFNTSKVTDMSRMFKGCYGLENIDIKNFDTRNVENMRGMFSYCKAPALNTVDLSYWNMGKVRNMSYMFNNCTAEKVILGKTSKKLTDVYAMFSHCNKLESVDLSRLNTQGVTDMSAMFCSCGSLKAVDLRNFSVGNVVTMRDMFKYCAMIKKLDLKSFHTYNLEDAKNMFRDCIELEELDISNFQTSKLKDSSTMFMNCKSLITLNLPEKFFVPREADRMFKGCYMLKFTDIDKDRFVKMQ